MVYFLDFQSKLLVEHIDEMIELILHMLLNFDFFSHRSFGRIAETGDLSQFVLQSRAGLVV